MHEIIEPNDWITVRYSAEQVRVLQIQPNTTIALGKYGSFPSNLLLGRPYHFTYEIQDRRDGEKFSRLRVVPAAELHADMLAESSDAAPGEENSTAVTDPSASTSTPTDEPLLLLADAALDETPSSSTPTPMPTPALAESDLSSILTSADPAAVMAQKTGVQTMTLAEIEALKREGATDAGRALVARLLASHTALARKTAYSRAKYRMLKVKKYMRRFEVLPLHVATLARWLLYEREAAKVMDLREETLALLGCWANVHFAGVPEGMKGEKKRKRGVEAVEEGGDVPMRIGGEEQEEQEEEQEEDADEKGPMGGRWLVVDDTGGLLVASMAERMGILHPPHVATEETATVDDLATAATAADTHTEPEPDSGAVERMQIDQEEEPQEQSPEQPQTQTQQTQPQQPQQSDPSQPKPTPWHHHRNHFHNMALTNTITVIHNNAQPSLHLLKYFNFDVSSPATKPPLHPLADHLLPLSWLQLLEPDSDPIYTARPDAVTAEELASWKASRKSTYFRKLRRWNRLSHVINSARAGGFSGLAVASSMDAASILQHTLPLLAPGAPVAVYAPTMEPLARLADLFSTARRTAWTSSPPPGTADLAPDELERWPGSDDFPLNPTLLLGAAVQSSRARRWQVLPGRTHPLMTSRGGADGFVFTAWKAVPVVGRIQARGKFKRRKME